MRMNILLSLIVSVILAGCEGSIETPAKPAAEPVEAASAVTRPSPNIDQADGKLRLEKVVFTVPEGWQAKPASSSFVLAEFVLPKSEADEADGRLTVSVAGGSIEANIDRWRDQFGGKPEQASQERKEINGLNVTLVDFAGEFSDQRGPFAPATKRAGYRMLAAVISVGDELHFVKSVGPRATMAAHADRFQQFIGSVVRKE